MSECLSRANGPVGRPGVENLALAVRRASEHTSDVSVLITTLVAVIANPTIALTDANQVFTSVAPKFHSVVTVLSGSVKRVRRGNQLFLNLVDHPNSTVTLGHGVNLTIHEHSHELIDSVSCRLANVCGFNSHGPTIACWAGMSTPKQKKLSVSTYETTLDSPMRTL